MRGAFERDFIHKVVLYAQAQEKRDLELLSLRTRTNLELELLSSKKKILILWDIVLLSMKCLSNVIKLVASIVLVMAAIPFTCFMIIVFGLVCIGTLWVMLFAMDKTYALYVWNITTNYTQTILVPALEQTWHTQVQPALDYVACHELATRTCSLDAWIDMHQAHWYDLCMYYVKQRNLNCATII